MSNTLYRIILRYDFEDTLFNFFLYLLGQRDAAFHCFLRKKAPIFPYMAYDKVKVVSNKGVIVKYRKTINSKGVFVYY